MVVRQKFYQKQTRQGYCLRYHAELKGKHRQRFSEVEIREDGVGLVVEILLTPALNYINTGLDRDSI